MPCGDRQTRVPCYLRAFMNDRIRVLSVDDHPHMREGIATVINFQPDMLMVAQASSGREAIERFREHKPDVTLMDLRLPDMSGIDAAVAIRTEFPEARIIILTTFESDIDICSERLQQGQALSYLRVRPRGNWWKQSTRSTPGKCVFHPNSELAFPACRRALALRECR